MTGILIALEGPDGVGKTTLARALSDTDYTSAVAAITGGEAWPATANASELVFVPRRQISATSPYAARLMKSLSTMLWHSGDSPDLPDSFWVPLQAAWFTAHATTVLQPLLAAGYDVIVDGWVFKFFSKLLVQGYTQADLDTIFDRVRMPDVVILLTADLAALHDRRGADFRPAELGMHAGYPELGRDTFIDYQRRGLEHLREYARRLGWTTADLDCAQTVAESVAVLAPLVTTARRSAPTRVPQPRRLAG